MAEIVCGLFSLFMVSPLAYLAYMLFNKPKDNSSLIDEEEQ